MKVRLASAAVAIVAFAYASGAQAQDASGYGPPPPGWYVRGEAGGSFSQRVGGDPTLHGENGWTVGGAVGKRFGNGFRTEGELLYSEADGKDGQTGRMKTLAGLLNAYYDFTTATKFRPFVGAGLGVGQVQLDGGLHHGDSTGFAYQLTAGVAYPIDDRWSAQVAYRYFGVNDVKIGPDASPLHGDYHDQAVTLGLAYAFGG